MSNVYMQTNEIQNAIIRYRRDAKGALTEVERVPTGGAGSGTFKPISGQESAPNAFEGAGSVISRRTGSFCLRPMAATTRSRASALAKMAGSRGSTSSRQGMPSRKRAAPPNPWPMPPRRACFMCSTRSAPTMCG
jgi:hypothetical protein